MNRRDSHDERNMTCVSNQPSTKEALSKSLEDFKIYARALNKVHLLLAKQPLSRSTPVTYDTILDAVSAWTTAERARTIADSLRKHFDDAGTCATAFRVSVLFSFLNDDQMWPVVEWQEDTNKELLALFHFDENSHGPGVTSWLVHYGAGVMSDETRWKETSIAWGVTDISHLKALFGAAQHFRGILEWPPAIAMTLYCQIEPLNASKEEYVFVVPLSLILRLTYYATLLCEHFHKIKMLEAEFDNIVSALYGLSNQEGVVF